ncbi:MAG: hypothetical protein Q7S66_00810 [bacterium]|nr:hypothetical protein [bacterium]
MRPNLKRILLIILFILVGIIIGFAIYFVFFKRALPDIFRRPATPIGQPGTLPTAGGRTPGQPAGDTTGAPTSNLPIAGNIPTAQTILNIPQAVTQITTDLASFPSTNIGNGVTRYYNGSDGKFYKTQADGTVKSMTDQVFFNVASVTWAKSKDVAVLEYPDLTKIVYNFDLNKQTFSPPKHWQSFSFSPAGEQLAAMSIGLARENRWLVTVNTDGTGTKLVEPLGDNADQVTMDWSPSRQVVAFSTTGQPQGFDRREVLFVGLNHENFKSTVVEGMGFQPQWSTTGQKLLYSVYSGRSDWKPELWVVNAYGDQIGSNRQMLNLNTWADKCAFANDSAIFCAVPRDLEQGAGMSPDIAIANLYDLYKIDLQTGTKINIPLTKDYHIKDVSYDAINNKVLFTDNFQNGIFQVNL